MSIAAHDRLARVAALRPTRRCVPLEPTRSLAAQTDPLADALGARVARNRYGEHLVVRQWHSTPEPCEPTEKALRLLLPPKPPRRGKAASGLFSSTAARKNGTAPSLSQISDPTQWLFLDTETTGLAGGTGTYAFLVGVAWWEAGGLEVEQFFMRDHAEEHSVLVALAERLAERPVLVTFNGKCFDWLLLETRYTITRSIRVPRLAAHLDLLHPARQLWRLRLGSVRLAELERQVLGAERLGWSRQWDIESWMIPQIYFDYLRGESPGLIAGVFLHNQMDLRGLAALAGKVMTLVSEPEERATDAVELYGVSRMHRRRGDASRARVLCERAVQGDLPAGVGVRAKRDLALLAKRDGDHERAVALWEELARGGSLEAYEQLAIYYEHRARDLRRATEIARSALAQLRGALCLGRMDPARHARLTAQFHRRLGRLAGKRLWAGGRSRVRSSDEQVR